MRPLAGDPGFEPGPADPESAVLPLDESPTLSTKNYIILCPMLVKWKIFNFKPKGIDKNFFRWYNIYLAFKEQCF